jgi:HTH-type transcriptional regulator, transcriptional repressor of NAD biosynthesis genes
MVGLCSMPGDEISGEKRFQWLEELAPGHTILHMEETDLHSPEGIAQAIKFLHPIAGGYIDYLYGGSREEAQIAEGLDVRFIPVDLARERFPVTTELVRQDPIKHWDELAVCSRSHFVKRVSVFGPESVGKSFLAQDLARFFETLCTDEYARTLVDFQNNEVNSDDAEWIVRGQIASEKALTRQANRVLFCDTDPLASKIWCHYLYGNCSSWIEQEAVSRKYDLTLLLEPDVEWQADPQRCLETEEQRLDFLNCCEEALKAAGRKYVRISGQWTERLESAIKAVKAVL